MIAEKVFVVCYGEKETISHSHNVKVFSEMKDAVKFAKNYNASDYKNRFAGVSLCEVVKGD